MRTLIRTWRLVRNERGGSAPWDMVRLYVKVELRHGFRRHDGDAQSCLRCYDAVCRVPETGVR
jgi:hypothetical protein